MNEKSKDIIIIVLIVLLVISHVWVDKSDTYRYEVVSLNDSSFGVIDHENNKMYQYFFDPHIVGSDKPHVHEFPE